MAVLAENGYGLDHTARRFQPSWFSRLDLVVALDAGHLRALRRLAPTEQDAAKVGRLLRSYDPAADRADLDVPDPLLRGARTASRNALRWWRRRAPDCSPRYASKWKDGRHE